MRIGVTSRFSVFGTARNIRKNMKHLTQLEFPASAGRRNCKKGTGVQRESGNGHGTRTNPAQTPLSSKLGNPSIKFDNPHEAFVQISRMPTIIVQTSCSNRFRHPAPAFETSLETSPPQRCPFCILVTPPPQHLSLCICLSACLYVCPSLCVYLSKPSGHVATIKGRPK